MTEEGLIVLVKSRWKYNSYQGELSPPVPNTISGDSHSEKPNEKWLIDITELATSAGKVYLSSVVDCFDGMLPWWMTCRMVRSHNQGRKIISWSILTGDAIIAGPAGSTVRRKLGWSAPCPQKDAPLTIPPVMGCLAAWKMGCFTTGTGRE